MIDPTEEWGRAQRRVIELVAPLTPEQAQLRAWTVRGDVEPCLGAFALLGSLPAVGLTE